MTKISLESILVSLQNREIRATYGAVGEVLGIPAIAVGSRLGERRPLASWVVSARTGKPSGYSLTECHARLYANTRIIRNGEELLALLETAGDAIRLMGIDLAWKPDRNGSGIAVGALAGKALHVERLRTGVFSLGKVKELIARTTGLKGLAIDAPLIIRNATGKRECEREVDRLYSAKWAGCHSSNLQNFPDAESVKLASWLGRQQFEHLGASENGKWQIECYPHPALIEIFGLAKRHAYKKGTPSERRTGQAELAKMVSTLTDNKDLSLQLDCPDARDVVDTSRIASLPSSGLKANEDALDAIICLYIAGLYAIGHPQQVFGTKNTGYIVVPGPA